MIGLVSKTETTKGSEDSDVSVERSKGVEVQRSLDSEKGESFDLAGQTRDNGTGLIAKEREGVKSLPTVRMVSGALVLVQTIRKMGSGH